jgi:hypothetical protein
VKTKYWNLIASTVGLFSLLAGTILCLKDSLQMSWWSTSYIIGCAFCVAVFTNFMYYKRSRAFLGVCLAILFGTFVIVDNKEELLMEIENIVYQTVSLINLRYRTFFWFRTPQLPASEFRYSLMLTTLVFGFLLGLYQKNKKLRSLFLLPTALSIIGGMLLGYPPQNHSILLLLFAGACFTCLINDEEAVFIRKGKLLAFTSISAALILSQLVMPLSKKLLDNYNDFRIFQLSIENKAIAYFNEQEWFRSIFHSSEDLSRVVLSNNEPTQTDENMFRITVKTKPKEPLYVRKFIGGEYDSGSWLAFDSKTIPLQGDIVVDGVNNSIYEPKIERIKEPKNSPLEFNLYNQGDISYTVFHDPSDALPYEESITKEFTKLPDQQLSKIRETAKEFTPPLQDVKVHTYKMEKRVSNSDSKTNNNTFKLLSSTYTEFVEQIKNYMHADTTYSLNLASLPRGKDIAEYFLYEQKKGFCVHYATAGALLLRAAGIPARYVSGYLVLPTDFRENADGTFSAMVKRKRAHAWVEVFESLKLESTDIEDPNQNYGGGWTEYSQYWWSVAEMTPPSYIAALTSETPDASLSDTVNNLEQNMEAERRRQELEQRQREQLEQQKKEPQDSSAAVDNSEPEPGIWGLPPGSRLVLRRIGFAFISVLIFILLIWLRKTFILARKRRLVAGTDTRIAIAVVTNEALRLLKELGYDLKPNRNESEYALYIQTHLPCFTKKEFVEFIEIASLGAFGNEIITGGQCSFMQMVYRKLEKYAQQKTGTLKKIYWKYFVVMLY